MEVRGMRTKMWMSECGTFDEEMRSRMAKPLPLLTIENPNSALVGGEHNGVDIGSRRLILMITGC